MARLYSPATPGKAKATSRRWIFENDWLEAIVALPLNMFYNTGIATYIWVLTNRKPAERIGKVQLIDAKQWFKHLRKNPMAGGLGQKGAPRPRFLALCFDDLHMRPGDLVPVKAAAERFVRTSLAPSDRVVIVRTSKSENVNFTSDVPTLVEQIANVTPYLRAATEVLTHCPAHFDPYEAYRVAEHMDPGDRVLNAKIAQCMGCKNADRSGCEGLVNGMAKAIWA